MTKLSERIRTWIIALVVSVSAALSGIKLMEIQIVEGASNLEKSYVTSNSKQSIQAARGEIVDRKGKAIVKNRVGFNAIIQQAFFPSDKSEGNRILLQLAGLLEKNGLEWMDTMPISWEAPYQFLENREKDVTLMKDKEHLDLAVYATAENCMAELIKLYEISPEYTPEEQRIIAGIRYEMRLRDFSQANRYTFAENLPISTVTQIREIAPRQFPGVEILEEANRVYEQGDILPQSIGNIGPIYAEEWNDDLKNKNYSKSDSIGKSGIERAMEASLRGENGTQLITMTNGQAKTEVTQEAVPGHSIKLTIDSDFQRELDKILADHIALLKTKPTKKEGNQANAGALAVISVKTGGVLGSSNFPTYNINDYLNNYSEVASRPDSPLINRAIDGQYRPGSTFKPVTAAAALNEGTIVGSDTVSCTGRYLFFSGYQPGCTGVHGQISVSRAIQHSCNIFFYDVGRRTGIDNIETYAGYFGLGQPLGLEIGGATGTVSSPEVVAQKRASADGTPGRWVPGDVIMTAIGQSETAVTPLQMAVQAATLANKGVRYKPYMVEGIYSYDLQETIQKTQPEIVSTMEVKNPELFELIEIGMIDAATNTPVGEFSLNTLPDKAAIKTGTPQTGANKEDTSSAFIGYYPVSDPQIAFAGFVEKGEYSKYMIRKIIDSYYKYYQE